MIRKFSLTLITAVGLAGCVGGPQTAAEFRSSAGGAFGKTTTITTGRSFQAVTASLRTGASKCMNRTVTNRSTTPGTYGPVASVYTVDYRAQIATGGGRTELALHQEIRGNLPQPNGITFVADARPTAQGTEVTMYGGRFGYAEIFTAVGQWAKGGAIVCLDLPWSQ